MKLLIAQGGGPTAVINQSLIAAILEAKKHNLEIIGARYGIKGIIQENFVDLGSLENEKLMRIAKTPGSALFSTRDKPDEKYCEHIVKTFQKHDIRGFLYIGGDDSSETIHLVLKFAKKANYELKGFHIPKTVDNDLVENDHTPGFPSAARFVAKVTLGIERDNASLPGIHLIILMGRHAGFLTSATALGGAHRVYIPEVPFDLENFAKEVKQTVDDHGRAIIGISEGIEDAGGNPIISQFVKQEIDSHGNAQLSGLPLGDVLSNFLRKKLGISRIRQDTLGYPQRSYPEVSVVDEKEAQSVGEKAIECVMDNTLQSGSITINRISNEPYQSRLGLTDLQKIAGKRRKLPKEYYDKKTKTVTEAGLNYLKPLVGELPVIETI